MKNRIIATIALVFMVVFSVFLIILLAAPDLFTGLNYLVYFSGGIGLALFLYLMLDKRLTKEAQAVEDKLEEKHKEAEEKQKAATTVTEGAPDTSANEPAGHGEDVPEAPAQHKQAEPSKGKSSGQNAKK